MVALCAIGCVAGLVVGISVAAAGPAKHKAPTVSDARQKQFAAAAAEFKVPESLLLAVSYALTGWSASGSAGGVGPMRLTDATAAAWSAEQNGRGRGANPATAPAGLATAPALHTLAAGAQLIGTPVAQVRADPAQNIRAGAALLRQYAVEATGGTLPTTLLGWYGALARYGTGDAMAGRAFADDVLSLVKAGVPGTTVIAGQAFKLAAQPGLTVPNTTRIPAGFSSADAADCPAVLACRFVPAAYAATGSGPAGYGNYDPADRPADGNEVRYLVIGDAGSTYDAAIAAAQQPTSGRSAHYLIRSSDGQVTQLVRAQDIAWDAGNWTINAESVGIQVESRDGGYSAASLRSAATLARWLAMKYKIPLDRQHVIGLDEVPGAAAVGPSNLTSNWNWASFMSLAGAPLRAAAWKAERVVTIAKGGSAVPLRTEPKAGAPLLTAGKAANDWSGKITAGQSYAVAGQQGDWVAIWFGGQRAWFEDPGGKLTLAGDSALVTAAPGVASVPLYAQIAAEPAAYPAGVPATGPVKLAGTLPAGQAYSLVELVTAQDYFARFDPARVANNHTAVLGSAQYALISYDHRLAFVPADDVELTGLD
jgi:hypothetical protein